MRDVIFAARSMTETAAEEAIWPLRAEGLVMQAGGKTLLDDVNLTLVPGRLTMVLGPNGAGKSLLLKVLHGLMLPTQGQVTAGGQPLTASVRSLQAMVFQKPVLLRRSVASNVDFILRNRGFPVTDRDRLLGDVGLAPFASQPARRLSGGEQQRLALARALAQRPSVLFLDEPTASLDPASALQIEEIVVRVRDTGTAVVFVSHDVAQARRLADDVVFLHRGRLVEHKPAAAFFAAPQSHAARDYLAGRLVL